MKKKKKRQRIKELIKYNKEQLLLLTKLSYIYCSPIVFAHYKAIWDTMQELTESSSNRRYTLNPPQQSLFLADLSICQHGLEASKQPVCWHTPWEKINSFCKHWVTTRTLCHVLGAWISSYMGQHPCFVFSVLANPSLLKGRAGRNPWWGAFTESIR